MGTPRAVSPPSSPTRRPRRFVEDTIAAIGLWSWDHAVLAILAMLLAVSGVASSLPSLTFESDVDRYLEEDDPIRVDYDALRDQFGRDDLLYLAITPPEIFEPGFLAELREIHERLEDELPYVEEVQSLVNARQTRGEGDTLLVDELLEEWPETPEEIAAIAQRARANPFYRNLYVSADGRTTGIVIEPMTFQPVETDDFSGFEDGDSVDTNADEEALYLTGLQTAELVNAAHAFVASLDLGDTTEIHLMGSPVTNQEIQEQTARDMLFFSALSIAVIALLLGVVFRRVLAILLPLLLVVLAVVATVGAMSVVDRPLTFVSQIIPSFILAVGVGFSVHVLAIYFQAVDRRQERQAAIEYALAPFGSGDRHEQLDDGGRNGLVHVLGPRPDSRYRDLRPAGRPDRGFSFSRARARLSLDRPGSASSPARRSGRAARDRTHPDCVRTLRYAASDRRSARRRARARDRGRRRVAHQPELQPARMASGRQPSARGERLSEHSSRWFRGNGAGLRRP